MDGQNYAFPESIKTKCSQNQHSYVLHLAVHKLAFPANKKLNCDWFYGSMRLSKLLGELSSCQVHVCAPVASIFCVSMAPVAQHTTIFPPSPLPPLASQFPLEATKTDESEESYGMATARSLMWCGVCLSRSVRDLTVSSILQCFYDQKLQISN